MQRSTPLAALLAGLVVAVPAAAQIGNGKIAFSNETGIHTVNPDGSGLAQLRAGGYAPRWSPNGSQLAFTHFEGVQHRLLVMNANGSNERVVATGSATLSRQPWSPNGTQIAFLGGTEIYVTSAAGNTPRRVTFDNLPKDPPVWSPVGSQLVYSSRVQESPSRSELFIIDAAGGTPTQITQSGPGLAANESPAWSPDGRAIAFLRRLRGEGRQIYTIHPDGSELHRVSLGSGEPSGPAWSPDGATIAFSTWANGLRRGRGREIRGIGTDGSDERRLTQGAPRDWVDENPSWSPDGERLLFRRDSALYTANADGTCEERLVSGVSFGEAGSWQPVPGGPSGGSKRCHAAAVEGTVEMYRRGHAALIRATVANEGTEPLTSLSFVATTPTDASFSYAWMSEPESGCSLQSVMVTCWAARLEPGESLSAVIEVDARRVGIGQPSIDVAHRTQLTVSASEQLLQTGYDSDEVRFTLHRCRTQTRGGGIIVGTRHSDRICGRQGADRIGPEGGGDVVAAGGGPDAVFARDGVRDRISCGAGRDRVFADREDLVGRDCERVSRR